MSAIALTTSTLPFQALLTVPLVSTNTSSASEKSITFALVMGVTLALLNEALLRSLVIKIEAPG